MRARGCFRVERGRSAVARLLQGILRMPAASPRADVRLVVTRDGDRELWSRWFDGKKLVTVESALPGGLLAERFGVLEVRTRLQVEAGDLVYTQVGAALRLGPVAIPLPAWLAPRVTGRESPDPEGSGTRVQVAVAAPFAGLLVRYEGAVEVEERR